MLVVKNYAAVALLGTDGARSCGAGAAVALRKLVRAESRQAGDHSRLWECCGNFRQDNCGGKIHVVR